MGLYNIFDVTGSALSAQSVRLNTVASNLANADVVATRPEDVYRSRQPVFAAVMQALDATPYNNLADAGQSAVGVRVAGIVESRAVPRAEYAPDHPLADDRGYIYHANVNNIEEMTNMMAASRSYQDTVEVFNTSKQLLLKTLNLGR
jgi:flagellar basal-body rod protein FlgC